MDQPDTPCVNHTPALLFLGFTCILLNYNPLNKKEIIKLSKKKINDTFFKRKTLNIINVGRLAGGPSEFNCDIHALRRINYKGVTFRTRSLDEIRKVFKDMWSDLSNVVSNGTLSMPIEKVFDFKDVSQALSHMRANKHFGKLILKL